MSHFPVLVLSRPSQSVDDLLLPYMENCCEEPPVEFMEFYEDEECDVDERTGKRGYWQNPNAKWDWFIVGGRFSGSLRTKRGRLRCDTAMMSNVSTVRDEAVYRAALHEFNRYLAGEMVDEFCLRFFKRDYVLDRYGSAEFYARYRADFWFRSVVTPDGEWHEVGKMGWWGISSESGEQLRDWIEHFHERFIGPYLDCIATVVDCHI